MTENKPKKVLIASLIADHEPWLNRFLDSLKALNYPKKLMRYAFIEGKHLEALHNWCYSKTCWIKHVTTKIQNRYDRLAYLRNIIVEEAHPVVGEDYVLWVDSDVTKTPPSLIKDLMKYDAPVIAPAVWIEETDPPQFYDTFAFRTLQGQPLPAWNLPYKGLVEVGSVGTCYMVASRLYSQSKLRYKGGDSEHVSFCKQVRQLKERVYVDFNIRIEHANLPKYGRSFH